MFLGRCRGAAKGWPTGYQRPTVAFTPTRLERAPVPAPLAADRAYLGKPGSRRNFDLVLTHALVPSGHLPGHACPPARLPQAEAGPDTLGSAEAEGVPQSLIYPRLAAGRLDGTALRSWGPEGWAHCMTFAPSILLGGALPARRRPRRRLAGRYQPHRPPNWAPAGSAPLGCTLEVPAASPAAGSFWGASGGGP